MNILALDLGTKTGFALYRPDMPVVSGVWNLASSRYEGGGMRYLAFERRLDSIGEGPTRPECIVFEEVRRHMSTDSAHVYGGLLAILTSWCEKQQPKVPYRGYAVGTIKKYATGKGNCGKSAMIAAAFDMGFEPIDDNEADALCLLRLACSEFDQPWEKLEG